MARILLIGPPKSGKTTLAAKMGGGKSTDSVMSLGWSEASAEVAQWFNKQGPWIVEGVAIPRALRKWHEANPGKPPPVDKIIYLSKVHKELTAGQKAMSKGIDTVLAEIKPWLTSVEWEYVK